MLGAARELYHAPPALGAALAGAAAPPRCDGRGGRVPPSAAPAVPRGAGVAAAGKGLAMTQTAYRAKHGLVQSPHGAIEYREAGEGSPVLLLHWNSASAAYFLPVLPLLAPHVRAIAMSTMGHGESDRPPTPYASLHEHAQATAWLLDGLGLERVHVVGTHTGAMIGTELAVSWPERVDRLVLEEPFNWNTERRRDAHLRLHEYHEPDAEGEFLKRLWQWTRDRLAEEMPGVEPDFRLLRQRFMDKLRLADEAPAPIAPMAWEGAGPYAMCHYEMWEAAPRVQAPTLVIHGTGSQLGRSHEKFLELIPHARGLRLPSEGNSVPFQHPELWTREVLAFLLEE